MEIARNKAKSGKVYRIYKEETAKPMYVIEYVKPEDRDFLFWWPAFEPQKVFTDFEDAKKIFLGLLKK